MKLKVITQPIEKKRQAICAFCTQSSFTWFNFLP